MTSTARRIAWPSLLATLAAGVAVAWLLTRPEAATTEQALTALRWASVLLAAGLASVFDDPTEADLAGAGTPIWCSRLAAVAVAMPATAAAWSLAVLIADRPLPWAMSVEAAALIALGFATASLRRARRSNVPAALAAMTAPVFTLIAAYLLPSRWTLYVLPDDPVAWNAAHVRWALLGAVGLLVTAVAARDPARRSLRRLLAPARPHAAPFPSPAAPDSELS